MTVIASAGPRARLQLLRVPVYECGDAAKRYQVRVIEGDRPVTIHTAKTFASARDAFHIEAYWRGWSVRTPERVA